MAFGNIFIRFSPIQKSFPDALVNLKDMYLPCNDRDSATLTAFKVALSVTAKGIVNVSPVLSFSV
jgi:hypothetical protein